MVVVVVVIGAVLFIKLEMFEVKTYIFIHFRNKLQCGFNNNKQMEEGEATVQERSVIIQRVNLLMKLKVPKLVRISVYGLFFIMETSDGRSCIFLIPLPYL